MHPNDVAARGHDGEEEGEVSKPKWLSKPEWFRFLVCGSRDETDAVWVRRAIGQEIYELTAARGDDRPVCIVHGACKTGVDAIAASLADDHYEDHELHPADWDKHGRAAGPIRNEEMAASKPEAAIVFPGGAGTRDMMLRLFAHGIP